ncbi:MFS transporter [Amycolatopsis methanolica]|uniref:MFS transporter n=1 Tax=Amycolatopsis methanolica TaxID=1814 RepID=UPI00037265E0|nr:MFS transporter [Amycolatopsis methanolica]
MATLVIACAAAFLVLVNFTAPLATLGEIADALGAGPAGQTWILGSISLGLAAALLIAGSLADTFGRRRVFVLGGAGLAAGSVLCALAPATWAALLVSSLGLIAHAHPAGAARVRATGLWGAMLGGGITGAGLPRRPARGRGAGARAGHHRPGHRRRHRTDDPPAQRRQPVLRA